MNFLDIIRSPLTNLPLSYTGSFRDNLKQRLTDFGNVIAESTDLSGPVNGIELTAKVFKRRMATLIQGIISTLDIYYAGDPSRAFAELARALREVNVSSFLNKELELLANTDLYRIRTCNRNYALSKHELFHIPFQLRSRVNTQRFSIPGLPSLYVANSIYVAWEELKRPPQSEIQACRLVNKNTMRMLDLTTDIYARNQHFIDNTSHGWEPLYRVMVWPLVAACSFKVQNPDDPFKPEYVIPQLLLQWVNKENVIGIKYSSTHIDLNTTGHEGSFYNIVFPVRTFDKEEGHCPWLSQSFRSTQVLPLELRGMITNSDRLEHQASISSLVNQDIQRIALIKGVGQSYHRTTFGIAEHNLKGIELEDF
jgi:hypothetical protein